MDINAFLDEQRESGAMLRALEVPEWGFTVYARARFTLEMLKPLRRFAEDNDPEALAEAMVRYALDENGERLFTREHKHRIMRDLDSSVVARVGGWIMGGDDEAEDLGNVPGPSESLSSSYATAGAEHPKRSNGA